MVPGPICADGLARYAWFWNTKLDCVPYAFALLVSRYVTNKDWLRYSDYGLFTGTPLPTPATCPSNNGFQICGGNCGACDSSHWCTGRSPRHPYGFCIPLETLDTCSVELGALKSCPSMMGFSCFTFTVEPEAQSLANKNGMCLPTALCQAAAAGLPGGGACSQ